MLGFGKFLKYLINEKEVCSLLKMPDRARIPAMVLRDEKQSIYRSATKSFQTKFCCETVFMLNIYYIN